MHRTRTPFISIALVILLSSCCRSSELPSWNEGSVKRSIIQFIDIDSKSIPKEDRIAVFDMDGTIACESPLWYEMYCAVDKLNDDLTQDSTLLQHKWYQYAALLHQNPKDTAVSNHWVSEEGNFIDSMIWKAFEGTSHAEYIDSCRAYLTTTTNPDKKMILGDMFYTPMLELIRLLQKNDFQVYIVSGSVQGVIWSMVPEKTTLSRQELIGTRQILKPDYSSSPTQLIIQSGIFTPKNNNAGKSENIYARLGKQPVFAFGNTTGDFDMLHFAINNKYKGVGYMLNHDDTREYVYPPYHGAAEPQWRDELHSFGGIVVSMKNDFKHLW